MFHEKQRAPTGSSGGKIDGPRSRATVTWRRDAHLLYRHWLLVPAKRHGVA
jgi:hypothetical protein